jgi:hypothetical protein
MRERGVAADLRLRTHRLPNKNYCCCAQCAEEVTASELYPTVRSFVGQERGVLTSGSRANVIAACQASHEKFAPLNRKLAE